MSDETWKEHVDFDGPAVPGIDTPCWLWTGSLDKDGYGYHKHRGQRRAHRVVFVILRGNIPDGVAVLHRCDVRRCVRPDHLFLGTQVDNMQDMDAKGRRALGDRHGSRTKPERRPRGDRNGARLHRERMPRKERHGCAKLTQAKADQIRRVHEGTSLSPRAIGDLFGVSRTTVLDIVRGKRWVPDE